MSTGWYSKCGARPALVGGLGSPDPVWRGRAEGGRGRSLRISRSVDAVTAAVGSALGDAGVLLDGSQQLVLVLIHASEVRNGVDPVGVDLVLGFDSVPGSGEGLGAQGLPGADLGWSASKRRPYRSAGRGTARSAPGARGAGHAAAGCRSPRGGSSAWPRCWPYWPW